MSTVNEQKDDNWQREQARGHIAKLEEELAASLPRRQRAKTIIKRCHRLCEQGFLLDARWRGHVEGLATFAEQVRKHRRKLVRSLGKPIQRGLKARLIEECPPDFHPESKRPHHRPAETVKRKVEAALMDILIKGGAARTTAMKYMAALIQFYDPRYGANNGSDACPEILQQMRTRFSPVKKSRPE